MSTIQHAHEQKRFIGYQNDPKRHQPQHIYSGEHINGGDQRWQLVQENHNGKKKHNQAQFDQYQDNLGGVIINHKQNNNAYAQDFVPQQPTDLMKKERRNKDRLQHLSKLLPQKPRWAGYMDVGCGNAEISATIAQYLGIGNVFGIDMFDEDDFNQPCMDLEIKYIQNQDNKIKMSSNSVDLVTCFMAIHHFEQLDLVLREIQRILQIEGYLFIREHDVPTKDKQLRIFIEEMHRKYPDHPTDGYMKLFDRDDLREVLQAYGFEHQGDSNYTGSNPQAVYHSLYVLKSKNINPRAKQLINNIKNEELNDSSGQEKNSFSNNQSLESIGSIGDEIDNKLSLGQQSSIEYDKKLTYEQFQQISERKSSSFDSPNLEKNNISPNKKNETPQKQNKLEVNPKNGFHQDNQQLNQKNGHTVQYKEEEDVYENIIKVLPSQKQQNKNNTQVAQKKKTLKSPIKQIPQPIYESPKSQIKANIVDSDGFVVVGSKQTQVKTPIVDGDGFTVVGSKQSQIKTPNANDEGFSVFGSKQAQTKTPVVDDDGFVVVGSKQLKQDKKQQQIQQKELENNMNEKESNQIDNEEVASNEKQKEVEEDENNSSFSNKETSNQFIYITNKKNKKRK